MTVYLGITLPVIIEWLQTSYLCCCINEGGHKIIYPIYFDFFLHNLFLSKFKFLDRNLLKLLFLCMIFRNLSKFLVSLIYTIVCMIGKVEFILLSSDYLVNTLMTLIKVTWWLRCVLDVWAWNNRIFVIVLLYTCILKTYL